MIPSAATLWSRRLGSIKDAGFKVCFTRPNQSVARPIRSPTGSPFLRPLIVHSKARDDAQPHGKNLDMDEAMIEVAAKLLAEDAYGRQYGGGPNDPPKAQFIDVMTASYRTTARAVLAALTGRSEERT